MTPQPSALAALQRYGLTYTKHGGRQEWEIGKHRDGKFLYEDDVAALFAPWPTQAQGAWSHAQLTAPAKIYLQHGDDVQYRDVQFPSDHDGISWCQDNVFPCDVEYVRADLAHPSPSAMRAALREALRVMEMAQVYVGIEGSNEEHDELYQAIESARTLLAGDKT